MFCCICCSVTARKSAELRKIVSFKTIAKKCRELRSPRHHQPKDYEQSIVWKDGFVASAKIYYENKYVDKLDGKTYIDTNLIEYRYEVNDDANITLPNPKDYTEVYELYDL